MFHTFKKKTRLLQEIIEKEFFLKKEFHRLIPSIILPLHQKKPNAYTTPLANITNAQKFFFPNQTHVANTLSHQLFTQPNDEIHSKMPRHPKSGINLLSKFAATTYPILTSHVEPKFAQLYIYDTENEMQKRIKGFGYIFLSY